MIPQKWLYDITTPVTITLRFFNSTGETSQGIRGD